MKYSILKNYIYAIGEELVGCRENYEGITRDPQKGIIPRGMILEEGENGDESEGCIASGINPGIANKWEMEKYKEQTISYERTLTLWKAQIKDVSYYSNLRSLIRKLGYSGPILWTDLAKCQSTGLKRYPPVETFRRCCNKFLSRELAILPAIEKWDIIAVGREPYIALSYLYPHRTVIGLTHPAAYGDFSRINRKADRLRGKLSQFKYKSVWLRDLLD